MVELDRPGDAVATASRSAVRIGPNDFFAIYSRSVRSAGGIVAFTSKRSNRPEDVLKVDADEDGIGGDDAADRFRYLVATKSRSISHRKLQGV